VPAADAGAGSIVAILAPGRPPAGDRPDAPVILVGDEPDLEARVQDAIDGVVAWVDPARGADALVAELARVLAPDAPPLAEQQRRARVGALEALARGDRDDAPERVEVHLTRLEPSSARASAAPEAAPRVHAHLDRCTPKQRELLDAIVRAGGVANAAVALRASRSTIYAALRRIAHRAQLRDARELLRLVGVEDHHHLAGIGPPEPL
jgi:hypothetical protein